MFAGCNISSINIACSLFNRQHMDLSIVIPLFNEDESLPELAAWIEKVVKAQGYSYEVIMVDDGSTDRSWAVIQELAKTRKSKASNSSGIMEKARR